MINGGENAWIESGLSAYGKRRLRVLDVKQKIEINFHMKTILTFGFLFLFLWNILGSKGQMKGVVQMSHSGGYALSSYWDAVSDRIEMIHHWGGTLWTCGSLICRLWWVFDPRKHLQLATFKANILIDMIYLWDSPDHFVGNICQWIFGWEQVQVKNVLPCWICIPLFPKDSEEPLFIFIFLT